MDRGRTPGQETRPTRDNGSKRAAGSGDPAYKGSSSGETPAAAGSGRSEPWRRTKPIPRAAARKLILPRASSASEGAIPRSAPTTTPSGAGSGRSEPWRRTPKIPRAQRESSSSPEPPQRTKARSRGAPQTRPAERDRSRASLGGEHQKSLAHSAKAHPPPSLLSERRTDPAKHPKHAQRQRDRAGASLGGEQTHPLARQRES
jgi:hypothetical protein